MTFAYFVTFHDHAGRGLRIDATAEARLAAILGAVPGLEKALILTPETTRDPYAGGEAVPPLALELYFPEIGALEAALAPAGHLQALAAESCLPGLAGAAVTQQAMLARAFPVREPAFQTPPGARPCTYLVHYTGPAEDLNLWLAYYIEHHPPVMARFPGIRQIEICTRLDWCGFLPWPRVDYMQRNKVVFDSAAALTAALNSPVREAMREDFRHFPPFSGENAHYAMATLTVTPGGLSA